MPNDIKQQRFECNVCGFIQEAIHPLPCPKCGHQNFKTLTAEEGE